jgi:type II secretion system protein H
MPATMKIPRISQPRRVSWSEGVIARASQRRNAVRRGFTLVETLIAITIVGLMAAVAVGRIDAIESHQRVSRATNSLQNGVQMAFALAVRDGHPVRLAWSSDSVKFKITNRGGDTTYRHVDLGTDPFNFTSSQVTVSRTPLEIYPNGLANDTLSVKISASSVTKTLRVTRAGLVAIQ